ncbi:ORF1 [Drosophila unispina virus 1]|uniref:ORF1 n=1 Tax=Drosophila unispina virus 1 TaxID=1802951 RepID=A0A140D8N2_9MONO|nr:ORF1 [Drosophila unispina virus 1]AMK09256.1 ORF1 [Drosophila unispina virus 1]
MGDKDKRNETQGALGPILSSFEEKGKVMNVNEEDKEYETVFSQLSPDARDKLINKEVVGISVTVYRQVQYPCVFWIAKYNDVVIQIDANHQYSSLLRFVDPDSVFGGAVWNDIENKVTYVNYELVSFLRVIGAPNLPMGLTRLYTSALHLKSQKIEVIPWSAAKLILGCLGLMGSTRITNLISELLVASGGKITEQMLFRSLQLGILGFRLWDDTEDEWLQIWNEFSTCEWENPTAKVLSAWFAERHDRTLEKGTFAWEEEINFAVFLSVHGHAKSYNETSAAESYIKRYKAFCSQLGNSSGIAEFQGSFTKTIWKPESLSKLQGILSPKAKKILYNKIVMKKTQVQFSWLSYVYLLMEGNGMTMVRETHNMLAGTPLKGFFDKRMVVEVRDFLKYYNKKSNDTGFLYSWYIQPDVLDGFAHAKFINLYSLTLIWCNEHGKMKNYNSTMLDKSIPKTLLNVADVTQMDGTDNSNEIVQEVQTLLHCKSNLAGGSQFDLGGFLKMLTKEYTNQEKGKETE